MYQPVLKNRGDFVANSLQDIQTIYLSETYATLQNSAENYFCQWTNTALGITRAKAILCFRMQHFLLEEVELFIGNKLPSQCSFFTLLAS